MEHRGGGQTNTLLKAAVGSFRPLETAGCAVAHQKLPTSPRPNHGRWPRIGRCQRDNYHQR
eukprot:15148142-Alexandrium_andersonii.AAC.1